MIYTLVGLVDLILAVAMWVIIAQVILSWLIVFNVINLQSDGVRAVIRALERITAPLTDPFGASCPILAASTFRRWC